MYRDANTILSLSRLMQLGNCIPKRSEK